MFEYCVFLPYTQLEAQKKCTRAARKMRPLDVVRSMAGIPLNGLSIYAMARIGENVVGWRTVLNNCYRRLAASTICMDVGVFEFRPFISLRAQ